MLKLFKISLLLFAVSLLNGGCTSEKTVTIGVISDIHQDIMHDGVERLSRFVEEMNTIQPDFIIQLGDFCRPYDYNLPFLQIFQSFEGPQYYVIGNHDMDGGFSRDSVVAFFHMTKNYYSFDQGGFHFVVLDGNDKNPSPDAAAGYARFIGKEQKEWLVKDLNESRLQTIVFSHQALRGAYALENAEEIRDVLEEANEEAGFHKVVASLNGHNHADAIFELNGIYYIEINSASYDWLGEEYAHESYSKEIHSDFPFIQYTAPYDEPLWAIIEVSSKGFIRIKGKEGAFKGPHPKELGHPGRVDGIPFSSRIRDTLIDFSNRQ